MDINAGVEAVISDPKVLEPRAEDGRATSQKSQRKVNNYLVFKPLLFYGFGYRTV